MHRSVVADARELSRHLAGANSAGRPAILLSASVPRKRDPSDEMTKQERAELDRRNEHYMRSARPLQIRSAVMELTKAALMREIQLIFGAHPAISPMVLDAARNIGAPPDSILIFQSQFFVKEIPEPTLQLADWSAGHLFLTREIDAKRRLDARNESLTLMRTIMVSPPNLRGAIFVGGMEGVEEEAKLFKEQHRNLPCYAVASTGSAAADLLLGESKIAPGGREQFAGQGGVDHGLLASGTSYSLLARKILADMKIE